MAINKRWKYARRISTGFVRLSETPHGPGIDVPRCLFAETLTEGKVYTVRRGGPDSDARMPDEIKVRNSKYGDAMQRILDRAVPDRKEAQRAMALPPHKCPQCGRYYQAAGELGVCPCQHRRVLGRRGAQKKRNIELTQALEAMASSIHSLKTWPKWFAASAAGKKPFEIRKNDRDFRVGDTLVLQEWDPITQKYSGKSLTRKITYIQRVSKSYVVMGLECPACVDRKAPPKC